MTGCPPAQLGEGDNPFKFPSVEEFEEDVKQATNLGDKGLIKMAKALTRVSKEYWGRNQMNERASLHLFLEEAEKSSKANTAASAPAEVRKSPTESSPRRHRFLIMSYCTDVKVPACTNEEPLTVWSGRRRNKDSSSSIEPHEESWTGAGDLPSWKRGRDWF